MHYLKRIDTSSTPTRVLLAAEDLAEAHLRWQAMADEKLKSACGQLYTASVPWCPPLTRQQFNSHSALWPCSFHEDKALERTLQSPPFPPEELALHQRWMAVAVEMALDGRCSGELAIGMVVVDPKHDKLLVKCFDRRRTQSPLLHCCLVGLDLAGRAQGGEPTSPTLSLASSWTYGACDQCKDAYLCTGCDVYVTSEPCVMCAMALLHSRVRRVFFAKPSPGRGGLKSLRRMHCERGLNHAFQVFEDGERAAGADLDGD